MDVLPGTTIQKEGDNRSDKRKLTHRGLFASHDTPEHPVDSIGNRSCPEKLRRND